MKKSVPKKKGLITDELNILSDPDEALKERASLEVDKKLVKRQKKKKMKGIASDDAAQDLFNLKRGTRKSREDYILQQIPKGLSEGSGAKPEVPDEPKGKTKSETKLSKSEKSNEETSNEDEVHSDEELHADDGAHDDEYIHDDVEKHDDGDEEMNDDENANEVKDDQVVDDAEKVDSEMTKEEKVDNKQAGDDKAKDGQLGALFLNLSFDTSLVGTANEPTDTEINSLLGTTSTPLTTPLPTPPILSEAPNITTTIPDPLPAVLQRLSDLKRKFEAWTKVDHSKAIDESVQANIINKFKNQLPKFLEKSVSDFVNPRIKSVVRDVLQDNPAFLFQHSSTPVQHSSRSAESLSELELKQILMDKMRKKEPLHEAEMDVEELILNDVVNDVVQPQNESDPKNDNSTWFTQPPRPETPDPEWTKDPTADDASDTPLDFSKFSINRLKLDKLAKADLVGPVYKLLKGTCRSSVELEYNKEQCYLALSDQLNWANPKGNRCPYDISKPLPLSQTKKTSPYEVYSTLKILSVVRVSVDKRFGYGYLNKIVNKLFNLDGDDIVDLVSALHMFTRSIVIKARIKDVQLGVYSYQKKLNLTKP
ncbi:hypothetical protein Tco_1214110 [Tanacetum coccineum]